MALFGQKKPKQFNFKPLYIKDEKGEETGLSEQMHQKWNRTSYRDLLKEGKKNTLRAISLVLLLTYLAFKLYNHFTQSI